MDARVSAVENRLDGVEKSVETLSHDVRGVSTNVSSVHEDLKIFMVEQRTEHRNIKPRSWVEIVRMITTVGTLVGMLGFSIYFLIDAKTKSSTELSDKFISQMTDHGGIFVTIHDLEFRVKLLEDEKKVLVEGKRK